MKTVDLNQFANRCVASCDKLLAQLRRARQAIQAEFRETAQAHQRVVQLALNEAEALAWQTEYPHLLFPALAQEKVQAVTTWNRRQRQLRNQHPEVSLAE